jgi:hypothetical protein
MLLSGIKSFFSSTPQTPAAVGSIPSPSGYSNNNQAMNEQPTEQDMQRLSAALDILGANDPKIVDHLEKLASMAQNKPGTFKTLLSMLENM